MGKICLGDSGEHSFEKNVQEQGYFICVCVFLAMLLFSKETETHLSWPNHKRKDAILIRAYLQDSIM